jgi:hypothetical protein
LDVEQNRKRNSTTDAIKKDGRSEMKTLIFMILLSTILLAQTLQQEYQVKKDYKKANISVNEKDSTMEVSGKKIKYEESYFGLLFVVMPNGDYIVSPEQDNYDYMDRICSSEHRYKVCLVGGLDELRSPGIRRMKTRPIWLLREDVPTVKKFVIKRREID